MKILITGTAGFIGHQLVKVLANTDCDIIGLDSINDYYDVTLKYARLADTGIRVEDIRYNKLVKSSLYDNYHFIRLDMSDKDSVNKLFSEEHFTHVCNLAGQPGVRYSLENPSSYIDSNIVGFLNILEGCRNHGVHRFVYASSSSVYGMGKHIPFAENDETSEPESLYAATKKSDEAMAFAYGKLFDIRTTGFRFFTVYGPWGRPDMAPLKFMKSITENRTIQVYNHGNMVRDFTYIDDIINGICLVLKTDGKTKGTEKVYNIGCSNPVKLIDFINTIEEVSGCKAKMEMLGMQPGDVVRTYSDTTLAQRDLGYKPTVNLREGIERLYQWYMEFNGMHK